MRLVRSSTPWKCVLVASLIFGGSAATDLPVDPGPRTDPCGTAPCAGSPFSTLTHRERAFFREARKRFMTDDTVATGLGPGFNGNSCAMCHMHPAPGGSSPATNPLIANGFPHLEGAANPVDLSGFLSIDGPVREVRFVRNPDGTPDGGVHDLFTVAGRTDAPGCTADSAPQPDFPAQLATGNMIYRIPTPMYGDGLVENTPDDTLKRNLAANARLKQSLGIFGRFNHATDGTISRFGWKAQTKSLLLFAGEAHNVEQGVTSDANPNDRGTVSNPAYQPNPTPEDTAHIVPPFEVTTGTGSELLSAMENFAAFARLLAPPAPVTASPSELNGKALFAGIGCSLCHSPDLATKNAAFSRAGQVAYHPYSDYALHHMGPKLADHVSQGQAAGDEFRTAPLWGLGQRLFFLHDGRTKDLVEAILVHASSDPACPPPTPSRPATAGSACFSEANTVIGIFNGLTTSQKQDIINFLRSL